MMKYQIIEELKDIGNKLGDNRVDRKELVMLYNMVVIRTCNWYPSWSKSRLHSYLEFAQKAYHVWSNRHDPKIKWLINGCNRDGYCYNEDILDAYSQLTAQ